MLRKWAKQTVRVFHRRMTCGISIPGGEALPIETAAGWDTVTAQMGYSLSQDGIQSQPGWSEDEEWESSHRLECVYYSLSAMFVSGCHTVAF